ncbi:MAG: twin-arginine translocase TatA/TatE family subunit [Candidatus Latescibacteria bacterium]|nr:twin-arginine translocase TatA/TatE family subunit [Candidatus Latescibacterota bacterium]
MEGGHVFGRIGLPEILIMALILVFIFGAKKIPELMRGMGQGIKEFRKGLTEGEKDDAQSGEDKEEGEEEEAKG